MTRYDRDPAKRAVEWITKTMQLAGITRFELARRLKIRHPNVYDALKGDRNLMMSTLFGYIEACGYEIVELRVRKKKT
jgi:hypothetical protein